MKPRWKTIVELVVTTACMFGGARLMADNAVWPPKMPETLVFVVGALTVIVFLELVKKNWNEL